MPSAIPKQDVSTTWAVCSSCRHRHPAAAGCPPVGWLVLQLCRKCTRLGYCSAHNGRS